jgi:hypothetical protein
MQGAGVAIREKPKPVQIAHLRLDHAIAVADGDSPLVRRIKEMNAFLESQQYISDQPGSKGQSADATKATIAKRRASPIVALVEAGKLGAEELSAARDIETAFMALSGALMFKPLSFVQHSKGKPPEWNGKTSKAVEQYRKWADRWTIRRKSHLDHTLECIIAAVIDQRPIRVIAQDLGFDFRRIERAVIAGLRDYAARAGWVDGKIAQAWMDAAEQVFSRRVG